MIGIGTMKPSCMLAAMLAILLQSAHGAGLSDEAERGRAAIERHGCIACHVIPGIPNPGSHVGPSLDKIATRGYIAGVLANTPQNMLRWLRDPPAIDPRTAMPKIPMSEQETKDIGAYLYTLK
jgi:cytochrome c551/c552